MIVLHRASVSATGVWWPHALGSALTKPFDQRIDAAYYRVRPVRHPCLKHSEPELPLSLGHVPDAGRVERRNHFVALAGLCPWGSYRGAYPIKGAADDDCRQE
jgi:hypothetical protein